MLNSFPECLPSLLDELSASADWLLPVKKPGSLGEDNGASLDNISTTDDMLGLSSGLCCTHNRPTWTDLCTSDRCTY
ncbi:hypothetical protein RND71_011329 [Anisodus tanguticus]|uniref:Uncharacterized protein n=1 Tax=Anisodus tanguticus TaxID=243964 RepID=A0AAE1VFZ3_9SOLA|nr:hypothetical protein RND71_011329 [Anisodus tanguticus]